MRAFIFPGQGAQFVGMGRTLIEQYPTAREVFQEADAVLGYPLSDIILDGPASRLMATEVTQPAILTVSLAAWRILDEAGFTCDVSAGLSLGEYAAHVVAGSIDLASAIALVRERGRLMQEAVPLGQGAMSAVVGLDDDVVVELCAGIEGVVEAVNFNCPGQVVVAGESEAVARLEAAARDAGARRVQRLDVSAPFHSSLLAPAREGLLPHLRRIAWRRPAIPVVANLTGEVVDGHADAIIAALADQVNHPVRWQQCIRTMLAMGVTSFTEIGPGRSLAGFVKRIDKSVPVVSVGEAEDARALLESPEEVC